VKLVSPYGLCGLRPRILIATEQDFLVIRKLMNSTLDGVAQNSTGDLSEITN